MFPPCESVYVSLWQHVVLEAPTVEGTTADVVLNALPGVYMSVCQYVDRLLSKL